MFYFRVYSLLSCLSIHQLRNLLQALLSGVRILVEFRLLSWEDGSTSLTTRFFFVQPCVHAVFGEAGVESLYGIAVRVGVAEEDFQGSLGFGHIHPVLEVMKRLYNGLGHGHMDSSGLIRCVRESALKSV